MTPGKWRKSTRSPSSGGNCVEARLNLAGPELRDSKAPELGTLAVSRTDFTALLDSVRLITPVPMRLVFSWWEEGPLSHVTEPTAHHRPVRQAGIPMAEGKQS